MAGYGDAALEVELDLHGLTVQQALETFVDSYNREVERAAPRAIRVVHGYGSSGDGGAIRDRLRKYLARYPGRVEWHAGEDLRGRNEGVTLVQPRKPLPTPLDEVCEAILDYCESPKPMRSITGKFRRYGEPQVRQLVLDLERDKRLEIVHKPTGKCYQATG